MRVRIKERAVQIFEKRHEFWLICDHSFSKFTKKHKKYTLSYFNQYLQKHLP